METWNSPLQGLEPDRAYETEAQITKNRKLKSPCRSLMGNCIGCGDCLSCASCQEAEVLSCECETQSAAAEAPASTTAETAVLHPGVAEVQHVQPIKSKRRKGLAGRIRSWVVKKWRHRKCCHIENEAPVQDPKGCTSQKLQEETSPDLKKPVALSHCRRVEVLQDHITEDIENDEMPPDVEKPAAKYHHRPVEVIQDLVLEDIEDDEMPPDVVRCIS
ncbi:uncharacterized protein LOC128932340 isoform X4 [Callithrix jacchus]